MAAKSITLGTSFTSILHMIVDRKDEQKGIMYKISEEADNIYLPWLAGTYKGSMDGTFTQTDPKHGKVASNEYKWFIWKLLRHAMLHDPINIPKIITFLQAWEEEAFPGMIRIHKKDPLYECYQLVLQSVGLENDFTFEKTLQLGNIPVVTILQRLTKDTVIPQCITVLRGGKRKSRRRKQRRTRKN